MTKEQLKDYLRQLSDEAGDCGNSEEWVKLRHDALVAVIDASVTTPVEPPAPQVLAGYRCEHEWKVKGLGGQAYCDICGVYRRDLPVNRSGDA